MAGTYEQQVLSAGVPQDFIEAERAKGKAGLLRGSNVDPQDINPLIEAYRARGNEVFSQGNVQSTVTNPLAPPNFSDPLGYLERLKRESGFSDAQKGYLESVDFLRQFDTGTQTQQNTIEDQLAPVNVITGRQASQLRLRSQQRASLADKAEALRDYLSAKSEEINTKYKIFQEQKATLDDLILKYPGAAIKYTDGIEGAQVKLQAYEKKAKKDAYKDALKQQLIGIGESTKGNTKTLEKRLRKYNKSLIGDAKKERDLKLQSIELDMANTRSLMANRGKESGSSISSEIRTVGDELWNIRTDKNTGEVIDSQRINASGADGNNITVTPQEEDTGGFWSGLLGKLKFW